MKKELHGHYLLHFFSLLSLLITLGAFFYFFISMQSKLPNVACGFMLGWLLLAIIFCFFMIYKDFLTGFLLSLFSMMIGWRIAAMYDVDIVAIPLLFAFLFFIGNFLYCAILNLQSPDQYLDRFSLTDWQLIFIRLSIGLNFVPHFTEKLFAGSMPHLADVNAFISLGVSHPDMMVWAAGLCEFGAAITLALGLFLRPGALGAVLYLLIATYLGHHFLLGFIWAGPGGGWEFATLWMMLILSFAVTGSHQFSLDQRLEEKYHLPIFIKKLL